jgi:prepilin-type N-terminal cleavage/methylation domain-containing protein
MNKKGFTLIELIIVVVIIGILALVAIPRYFASVQKARKSQAVVTLTHIKDAMAGYYAVNGILPAVTPGTDINVIVDGDTVMRVNVPSGYSYITGTGWLYAPTVNSCTYCMHIPDGQLDCSAHATSYPECN